MRTHMEPRAYEVAAGVVRGVAGMALPRDFWEASEHGAKGGVDVAT